MHAKSVVGKRETKILLERPRCVQEDNIKAHLNEINVTVWTGLKCLEIGFNGNFL
jgi:hypothetical protein